MMKLKKKIPLIDQHNKSGFWGGKFGGNFIPETLKKPIEDLTTLFEKLRYDQKFLKQRDYYFKNYIGSPTSFIKLQNLSNHLGRVQITGMRNAQEATDVALLLRAGSLATPMEIVEERTVGPSMGKENIARGINSTIWGFLAIAIMMASYYMLFGVISVIGLSVNLLFLVALLSVIQATLTLPG